MTGPLSDAEGSCGADTRSMSGLHSTIRILDPELTRRVREGRYVVPAERVAEAILRRRDTAVEPANVSKALAEVRRGLAMLVAGEPHPGAVPPAEHDPAARADPA